MTSARAPHRAGLVVALSMLVGAAACGSTPDRTAILTPPTTKPKAPAVAPVSGQFDAAVTCPRITAFYDDVQKLLKRLATEPVDESAVQMLSVQGVSVQKALPLQQARLWATLRSAVTEDLQRLRRRGPGPVADADMASSGREAVLRIRNTFQSWAQQRCTEGTMLGRSPANPEARVLVLGDSVGLRMAGQWSSDVTDGKLAVTADARLGCGVLPGTRILSDGSTRPIQDECVGFQDAWRTRLADRRPDVVLVQFGAWDVYDQQLDGRRYDVGTPEWRDRMLLELESFLSDAAKAKVAVVIVRTPCYGQAPDGTLADPSARLDGRRVQAVSDVFAEAARRHADVARAVELDPAFCGSDAKTYRADGTHPTLEGSALEWRALLPGLLAAAASI